VEKVNWNKYLGIPWLHRARSIEQGGLDCYGLVRHFYRNEYGIDIPKWEILHCHNGMKATQDIAIENNLYTDNPFIKVDIPQEGDLILFNILGFPIHVGIYIDNNSFLHSRREDYNSEIVKLDKWRNRIDGFYRIKN
jgi:cell wall-associated NlpC family hydrolase